MPVLLPPTAALLLRTTQAGHRRDFAGALLAVLRAEGLIDVRHGHGTFGADTPQRIELRPGDSATSTAAVTITRTNGDVETYPAGTTFAATS